MVGAQISCVQGSDCTVTCRGNACKNGVVFVAATSSLVMDPPECHPSDPNFVGPSKKDPSKPAKALGIHCPTIRGPGARLEDANLDRDQFFAEWNSEWELSADYIEMVEAAQVAERALDAMIDDKVAVYEDNLYLSLPDYEMELMVVGHEIMNDSSNILRSNLLTALIVFIMTAAVSLCYVAYKFGGNSESKALLE